mgnify:CR=1 FL=1
MEKLLCNKAPFETMTRVAVVASMALALTGCGTVLAVADGVGTAAVYGVKTVINAVDAITPDIVNKK